MENTLKTVSKTDEEIRVANYLVLFGGRDLDGETFTADTDFESSYTKTGTLYVDWEHGLVPEEGLGRDDVLGIVDWKSAKRDEKGLWVERVLSRQNQYMQFLEDLIEEGLVGSSSEATKGKEVDENGVITRWPLKRDALTVVPAEPRMLSENAVQAIKALSAEFPNLKSLLPEDAQESVSEDERVEKESDTVNVKVKNKETSKMTEEIKNEVLEEEVVDVTEGIREDLAETKGELKSLAEQVAALVDKMENEPAYRDAGFYSPVGGSDDPEAKSFSDFVLSVMRNDTLRLSKVYGKTAMGEQSGKLGGYLVPEEFHNLLVEAAPPNIPWRERCMSVNVNTDAGKVPALDQQTAVTAGSGNTAFSGGVNAAWVAEGSAGSETNINLKQIEYNIKKISAYTSVSNELLADSAQSVDALMAKLFGRAVNSLEEHGFIRGSGAGAPLGLLNAGAAVAVTPDTNSQFGMADGLEMISRFMPVGGQPMWIAHRSIIPDFYSYWGVKTGGIDFIQPREGVPGQLLGYDLFYSEHMPQANGDCPVLVDPAAYYIFDRSGLMIAFSEHSSFTSDQGQFRVTKRLDGQPGLQGSITLADPTGSYTVSPIVYFND